MDNVKSAAAAEPFLAPNEGLSALADGECDGELAGMACRAWREDPGARAVWHAYALIGDVLRSEDLAASPAHDAAFLDRLRLRLADEPVVLAPRPVMPQDGVAPNRRPARRWAADHRRWGASAAVAAGVLAVAGVTTLMRGGSVDDGAATRLASTGPVALQSLAEPAPVVAMLGGDSAGDGAAASYVRDPDIDRYLAAHRHYALNPVLATPGGLRQVLASPAER